MWGGRDLYGLVLLRQNKAVNGAKASKQGVRIVFPCGSRAVFRLSGTGSKGATIRLYLEMVENDIAKAVACSSAPAALEPIGLAAISLSQLEKKTGRTSPSVIT